MSNVSKGKHPCPVCGTTLFRGRWGLRTGALFVRGGTMECKEMTLIMKGGANDMSVNQYREAWLKGLPRS